MIDWMEEGDADLALDGLKALLNAPWFTRLWVYQEMVNSSMLLCYVGNDVIEWDNLKVAIHMFSNAAERYHRHLLVDQGKPSLNFIKLQERLVAMSEPQTSLLTLARASRSLGVQQPHDRIYALFSMTKWIRVGAPLPRDLRPDYSVPLRECISLATKAMIEETQNLDVFHTLGVHLGLAGNCRGEGAKERNVQWPSWCPKWHEPISSEESTGAPGPLVYAARGATLGYALCRGRDTVVMANVHSESPYSLALEGIIADAVLETYDGLTLFKYGLRSSHEIQALADRARANTSPVEEDMHELATALDKLAFAEHGPQLLLTMIEEIRQHLGMRPTIPAWQILEALLPLDENHEPRQVIEKIETATVDEPNILDFVISIYRRVCSLCLNSTIFRSMAGRIGIGPISTLKGDTVVVLWGGSTPFMLRPAATAYLYVGVAHVRGIMQGEAVLEWEEARSEATVFEIR